jgi:hypothetical protein
MKTTECGGELGSFEPSRECSTQKEMGSAWNLEAMTLEYLDVSMRVCMLYSSRLSFSFPRSIV